MKNRPLRTFAHISDLHLGRDDRDIPVAEALCEAFMTADVEHVVISGDVTHRGLPEEVALLKRIFAPLSERIIVVPGNHDRLGDGGSVFMDGARVEHVRRDGVHMVRVDSTAYGNTWFQGQGHLTADDHMRIDAALAAAEPGALTLLVLHHHLLPLPHEMFSEWLAAKLGWIGADELHCGKQLLKLIRGRCDLVLHGHRHIPGEHHIFADDHRPIRIFNAGSSTKIGRARLFTHHAGKLVGEPRWLNVHGNY